MARFKPPKDSTTLIHEITEQYSKNNRVKLMRDLKILKERVESETYFEVRRIVLPLTNFETFKQLK